MCERYWTLTDGSGRDALDAGFLNGSRQRIPGRAESHPTQAEQYAFRSLGMRSVTVPARACKSRSL